MTTRYISASLAAFTLAFIVAPSALAQEIIVTAPRERGRASATGAPIELVTTSKIVSTSGLDLQTDAGMKELEKRVQYAAKDACDWLDQLYPVTAADSPPCVKTAVEKAMADVRAMAAAKQQ